VASKNIWELTMVHCHCLLICAILTTFHAICPDGRADSISHQYQITINTH